MTDYYKNLINNNRYLPEGWDADAVVGTAAVFEGKDNGSAPNVLYAQWVRNYTLTYHLNYIDGRSDPRFTESGRDFNKPVNYTMMSWPGESGPVYPYHDLRDIYPSAKTQQANQKNYYFMGWSWEKIINRTEPTGTDNSKVGEPFIFQRKNLQKDADGEYLEFATDRTPTEPSGYTFLGWATLDTVNSSVTLTAQWKQLSTNEPKKYKLIYNANGATGGTAPATAEYDEGTDVLVSTKGDLVRTNYNFKEWNTKPDGTDTGYRAAQDSITMPDHDVTLYAIWVDDKGHIPSPGTGESAAGLAIAFSLAALSIMGVGLAAVRLRRKREQAR